MIDLRPYQTEAIERIRNEFRDGRRRVLFQLPTGGGKTVIFSFVVRNAVERGKRVCVLAHRQEIVEQIDRALDGLDVPHGLIAADHPETDAPVQVASVMTLVRRLDRYAGRFELIVVDECHHSIVGTWRAILDAFPEAFVLGVSATPERLDGKGLGDIFEAMVCGPGVAELTRLGFLSPAKVYAPPLAPDLSGVRRVAGDYHGGQLANVMSDRRVVGDAVEHYGRLAAGKPAIAFCCSIAHSQLVAERFREAGWRAEHVDGDTPSDERRARIAALGNGEIDVLTNCALFGEGVDVPALGAAILLRPTISLALHLQMVGRALRPAPGKEHAVILDHAGNSMRHGLPADDRTWSLESRMRRESRVGLARDADGLLLPRGTPDYTEVDGNLSAMDEMALMRMRVRGMRYRDMLAWANSPDKVRFAAAARGYKRGWTWHRIRDLRAQAEGAA